MTELKKVKLTVDDLRRLAKSKKEKVDPEVVAKSVPVVNTKVNHGKVVNYYVEYEDGTALLAQGDHAHLIYRFTLEAQKLATMHAFAYYEGPGMKEFDKELAIKLIEGVKDEQSK